ncbi:ABC transporter substrate-binding protein [Candidatus Formimonas warabiya]|nr:ABC transporter substrate-binding protein [Candidatus Formimonas warabiya]
MSRKISRIGPMNEMKGEREMRAFHKVNKSLLLLGILLVSAGLLLTGCGGQQNAAEDQQNTAPKEKIIRISASDVPNIDPGVGVDYSSATAACNIYSTLVFPNADGSVRPMLATDWDSSTDGLTWTFNLKQGVKFHNGDELTADDVVFSMNRLLTMGEGFAYLFTDVVKEVKAVEPYKVQFTLKKTFGPFVSTLVRLYIVNQDQVMANLQEGTYGEFKDYGKEWLASNDAGSGPYMVKEIKKQEHLLATKFPDYFEGWDADAPDTIKIVGTTETATIRTLMSTGELEITDQWQTEEALKALDGMPGVGVDAAFTGSILNIMLNTKKAPTDDVHFRKALAYLFDYQTVVDKLFPGSKKARGPVPFNIPGFNDSLPQYERNVDKAKAELAQSKYADKLADYPVELVWIAEVPDEEKIALLFQANAAELGITVDIVKTPWLSFVDQVATKETTPNAATVFVSPSYNEAGSTLSSRYHSKSTGTWEQAEWLQDANIDAAIEDAIGTVDETARMEKYKAIQQTIVDLCPTIWVFDQAEKRAYQENYITWPGAEANKAGQPVNPVMGYNFYFHDYKVFPDKMGQ